MSRDLLFGFLLASAVWGALLLRTRTKLRYVLNLVAHYNRSPQSLFQVEVGPVPDVELAAIVARHPRPWRTGALWPDECPVIFDANGECVIEADGPNQNEHDAELLRWVVSQANREVTQDA